jgi:hypothetical protein
VLQVLLESLLVRYSEGVIIVVADPESPDDGPNHFVVSGLLGRDIYSHGELWSAVTAMLVGTRVLSEEAEAEA